MRPPDWNATENFALMLYSDNVALMYNFKVDRSVVHDNYSIGQRT